MTRSRRETLIVAALMAAGAALRWYRIGAQSLWFDELLSVTISRLPLGRVLTSPASVDPPLYYVMLHLWLTLGRDDGIIRTLSAIGGIATIPAVHLLGRQLFDVRVGLTAALIFALAPLQVFFAQEARMYTWLVCFATLSLWTYGRARDSARARDWVLWAAVTTLGVYAHSFMGLLLIALNGDALLRVRRGWRHLAQLVTASLAVGLAHLPWLFFMLGKLRWLLPALWLERPQPIQPLLTLYHFVFGYTLPPFFFPLGLALLAEMLVFTLRAVWRAWPRHEDDLRLLLLATFVPVLLTWCISQWRPVYSDRLLLESAPALYVLIAWGVVASERCGTVRLGAVASLPLVLLSLGNSYVGSENGKPRLREVITYVADRRARDELVVHTSDSSFLAGCEYDRAGRHLLLYNERDQWLTPALLRELGLPYTSDAAGLLRNDGTFWLVVALDHIEKEQLDEKALFDRRARLVEEHEIGGIGIYHYAESPGASGAASYPG